MSQARARQIQEGILGGQFKKPDDHLKMRSKHLLTPSNLLLGASERSASSETPLKQKETCLDLKERLQQKIKSGFQEFKQSLHTKRSEASSLFSKQKY